MKLTINNKEVLATRELMGNIHVLAINDDETKKYLTLLRENSVIPSVYKIKIPYEDGTESGFFDGCFFINGVIYFDYWEKSN